MQRACRLVSVVLLHRGALDQYISETDSDTDARPWIGRRGHSPLFSRAGRPKCGKTQGVATQQQSVYGGYQPGDVPPPRQVKPRDNMTKRTLLAFLVDTSDDPRNIIKRVLAPFPEDKATQDRFMVEQVDKAATDVVPDP